MHLAAKLRWEPTLKALKCLEKLLSRRLFKERYIATCVTDRSEEERLKGFSGKLGASLRWNAVTEFCKAVTSRSWVIFYCFMFHYHWLLALFGLLARSVKQLPCHVRCNHTKCCWRRRGAKRAFVRDQSLLPIDYTIDLVQNQHRSSLIDYFFEECVRCWRGIVERACLRVRVGMCVCVLYVCFSFFVAGAKLKDDNKKTK